MSLPDLTRSWGYLIVVTFNFNKERSLNVPLNRDGCVCFVIIVIYPCVISFVVSAACGNVRAW